MKISLNYLKQIYVLCLEDLVKFAGRCVNNKDKNLPLNVVETLNSPNEETCIARCKFLEKVEPLFNACQYLSDDNKCELIYDDISYGSGESNNAACFVFHNNKFKKGNKISLIFSCDKQLKK